MPTITVEDHGEIQADASERLNAALERGGLDVLHRCGGIARCTTCRVEFVSGEPERMTRAERDKLEEKGLLGTARLSCQILCAADMHIRLLQTVRSTGLEPGKAIGPELEPAPEWVDRA